MPSPCLGGRNCRRPTPPFLRNSQSLRIYAKSTKLCVFTQSLRIGGKNTPENDHFGMFLFRIKWPGLGPLFSKFEFFGLFSRRSGTSAFFGFPRGAVLKSVFAYLRKVEPRTAKKLIGMRKIWTFFGSRKNDISGARFFLGMALFIGLLVKKLAIYQGLCRTLRIYAKPEIFRLISAQKSYFLRIYALNFSVNTH